jgi:hypothetical protein
MLNHKSLKEVGQMAIQRVWVGEGLGAVIASCRLGRQIVYKRLKQAKGKGRALHALRARKAAPTLYRGF